MVAKYSQKSRMRKAARSTNIIPFMTESANDALCEKVFGMNERSLDGLVGRLEGVVGEHAKHIDRLSGVAANLETKMDAANKDLTTKIETHAATTLSAVGELKTQVTKQGFINSVLIWIGSMVATAGVQVGLSSLKKLF